MAYSVAEEHISKILCQPPPRGSTAYAAYIAGPPKHLNYSKQRIRYLRHNVAYGSL